MAEGGKAFRDSQQENQVMKNLLRVKHYGGITSPVLLGKKYILM